MAFPRSADGTPTQAKQQLELGRAPFKRLDNGTELMNVNGLAAGAQLVVWNGTGGADTGGDWTVSGSGSEQAAADAGSGTNGWDSGVIGANNETDFDNGSELAVTGTYDVLTFMLQPKSYPNNANLQIQWRNGVGAVIGTTLNVENYVSNMDLDVWQQVTIPIGDFNLTADVQVLRVVYKTGSQHHYIDDVELQASGGAGPYTFRVQSPTGSVYHAERLIIVVSAADVGWASTAFANIAGGLASGLLLKYHNTTVPETFWTINARDNAELFGQFEAWNDINFDGGEQLVAFSINPDLSSVILIDDDDVIDIIIRDDLSSLTSVRAYLHYGKEIIPP